MSSSSNSPRQLERQLGLAGAVIIGLASTIGTGVFVSLGIAAGVAGSGLLLALLLAGLLAICNGLNAAQLTAANPVSGSVYEYGYRYLTPALGFTAGWTYVVSKVASCATAALGFAGYLLSFVDGEESDRLIPLALGTLVLVGVILVGGIHQSKLAAGVTLSISLLALFSFIGAGSWRILAQSPRFWELPGEFSISWPGIFEATALMFVAYGGYGRIATLGEEVKDPKTNIPRAIIGATSGIILLYLAIAAVCLLAVDGSVLAEAAESNAAPLETVATCLGIEAIARWLSIGAMTAMLSVLLSAILGLSRILLAMGRRGDMPGWMAKLNAAGTTPYWSVLVASGAIAATLLIGDIKLAWSFSAFTALIRSAITNLSALRMNEQERMFPVELAWIGLASCLFLAFWVEWQSLLMGLTITGVGLIGFYGRRLWVRETSAEEGEEVTTSS